MTLHPEATLMACHKLMCPRPIAMSTSIKAWHSDTANGQRSEELTPFLACNKFPEGNAKCICIFYKLSILAGWLTYAVMENRDPLIFPSQSHGCGCPALHGTRSWTVTILTIDQFSGNISVWACERLAYWNLHQVAIICSIAICHLWFVSSNYTWV